MLDKPEGIAKEATVTISPPDIRTAEFLIRGTAPLVINAFSEKAQAQMKAKQEAGSTAQSKRKRPARDFDADLQRALHLSTEGWDRPTERVIEDASMALERDLDVLRRAEAILSRANSPRLNGILHSLAVLIMSLEDEASPPSVAAE